MAALLVFALWLLLAVFGPLKDALLLAAALAALTHAVLYDPLLRWSQPLANWAGSYQQRYLCGVTATVLLVLLLLSPFLLLLAGAAGSLEELLTLMAGVMLKDPRKIDILLGHLEHQAGELKALYPRLPFDPHELRDFAAERLSEAADFAPSFLTYVFKGTGGLLAQGVLALVALSFFYTQGPDLVRRLLRFTPLSADECERLMALHRRIVLRLLSDTAATALAKGIALGVIAWAFTGLHFALVGMLAAFVSLIPVIGSAMVWVPLASLLWTQGRAGSALALAILSIAADVIVNRLSLKLGRRLHDQGSWMSFFLFLSLIGGLLQFGFKGLVVGPMVVVISAVLGSFLLPLYGPGPREEDSDT